jgi:hypothetical protein
MKQSKPPAKNDLKIGDRVKLLPGSPAWKAEITLQGKIGDVIECGEGGRVSIRFENGRLLMGRAAGQFERLVELKVKK